MKMSELYTNLILKLRKPVRMVSFKIRVLYNQELSKYSRIVLKTKKLN